MAMAAVVVLRTRQADSSSYGKLHPGMAEMKRA